MLPIWQNLNMPVTAKFSCARMFDRKKLGIGNMLPDQRKRHNSGTHMHLKRERAKASSHKLTDMQSASQFPPHFLRLNVGQVFKNLHISNLHENTLPPFMPVYIFSRWPPSVSWPPFLKQWKSENEDLRSREILWNKKERTRNAQPSGSILSIFEV